jgi:hypothetical protein
MVLNVFRKRKLFAKLKKCEFWLEEVSFLGHVVNKNRLVVDLVKIEAIVEWERPTNVREIRSFLGLVAYYLRFIAGFSMLVCDWLHSVGQNHFYVMMLFNRDSVIESSSRRVCTAYKLVKSNPFQSSRRRDIPFERSTVQASSVRTMRPFHPDLPLCREASNCSSLHPSGRFGSTSKCHSMFNQLWDFFPKHR